MDGTLRQILGALYEAHAEIDQLREELAELKRQLAHQTEEAAAND